jgi:methionine-rich copper-binding protein CopC
MSGTSSLWLRRAATVTVLLGTAVLAGCSAAATQDTLLASTPADGAALATAPSEVDLTFSAAPDATLSHAAASNGRGDMVASGRLSDAGRDRLRLPVTVTEPGDYLLAYHIEFADGGELTGMVRFSVGTGAPPAVADPLAARSVRDVAATHHHDIDPIGASLLVVDGLVLVVVCALLRRRPSKTDRRPSEAGGRCSEADGRLSEVDSA